MATGVFDSFPDTFQKVWQEVEVLGQQMWTQQANSLPPLPYLGAIGGAAGQAAPVWGVSTTTLVPSRFVPVPTTFPLPRLDMKESISVQVTLNADYQLHSIGTDPAVIYADGRKEFYIKGVRVPEFVVTQPHRIKVDDINKEVNVEVRRIMMGIYGLAKYLQNSKAEMLDEDEFGKLWRVMVPGDEPLVMVQVRNSTAEPDGTFKDYWLRVPPNMSNPAAAIAWTFRLDPGQYDPVVQT